MYLDEVLDAIEDEDLDVLVLGRHENGLEGAQEKPLEVEIPELLLVHELEGQLLQGIHGVLGHLLGSSSNIRHQTQPMEKIDVSHP